MNKTKSILAEETYASPSATYRELRFRASILLTSNYGDEGSAGSQGNFSDTSIDDDNDF